MSYYGDGGVNDNMNYLMNEMKNFVEEVQQYGQTKEDAIMKLLEITKDVIRRIIYDNITDDRWF